MPQADYIVTVPFSEPPTGIFAEVSGSVKWTIDAVHNRLDQISAMVWLMKHSEELPPVMCDALAGIETMVGDAAAMLSICGEARS